MSSLLDEIAGIKVHVSVRHDGSFYVSGEANVPGIGVLNLADCLSKETCELLMIEVAAVARFKLPSKL